MELYVFTAIFSAIFFLAGNQTLYAANLFVVAALKFILAILTFLFPFIGLFIAVILVRSFYKKDYQKYFKVAFVSFLLFFGGLINFLRLINGETVEFVSFFISTILLLALKEKNIKYIGMAFIMMLSFLMRYYCLL